MTEKQFCVEFIDGKPIGAVGERFSYDYHDEKIIDNQTKKTYNKDNYHLLVINGLLNKLNNENELLKKQMQRLYNYFVDWHGDTIGANQFSEMWDDVKEDEDWDD